MKWLARNGWVLSLATLVGVLVGLVINYVEDAETRRIVTESPCQIDAASRECQSIRREAEQAESNRTNCISFRQANYPCPRGKQPKGSERDGKQSPAGAESSGGSGAPSRLDPGGNGSSPGGGPSPAPSDPGGGPPPTPQPIPPSPPGPSPEPPPRNPQPSIGGGVDKVVEGVGETVSGAKGTVCDVAGICVP